MPYARTTDTMLDSERDIIRIIICMALGLIATVSCAIFAQQVGDHAMHLTFDWVRTLLRFPDLSEIAMWISLLGTALCLTYCVYGIATIRRERNMLHAMAVKAVGHNAVQGRQNWALRKIIKIQEATALRGHRRIIAFECLTVS
jgi:hypothetical protein